MKRIQTWFCNHLLRLLPFCLLVGCTDSPTIDDQSTGTEERPNEIPGGQGDDIQEESEEDLKAHFSAKNEDGVLINYHRTGKDECEVVKGDYSGVMEIPAKVRYKNQELKVTSIESLAFAQPTPAYYNPYYTGITEVSIPSTMRHIGRGAFYECRLNRVSYADVMSMLSITYEDGNSTPMCAASVTEGHHLYVGNEEVSEMTVPEGVTRLQPFAFGYCDSIARINLPSTLREIDDYAFICCRSLKEVNLPEGLTSIGCQAFDGCALRSIRIPEGVTELKKYTFTGNWFNEVFVCSETPPSCDPECFSWSWDDYGIDYIPGTLYVPEGCKEAYLHAEVWNMFRYIKEFDHEGNIITNTDVSMLIGTWCQTYGGVATYMRFTEDHKYSEWYVRYREEPSATTYGYTDVPFTFDADLLEATIMPPGEEPFTHKFDYITSDHFSLGGNPASYWRERE